MIRKIILLAFAADAAIAQTDRKLERANHAVPRCNFNRGSSMTIDTDDDVQLDFTVNWGTSKPFFMGGQYTCLDTATK